MNRTATLHCKFPLCGTFLNHWALQRHYTASYPSLRYIPVPLCLTATLHCRFPLFAVHSCTTGPYSDTTLQVPPLRYIPEPLGLTATLRCKFPHSAVHSCTTGPYSDTTLQVPPLCGTFLNHWALQRHYIASSPSLRYTPIPPGLAATLHCKFPLSGVHS